MDDQQQQLTCGCTLHFCAAHRLAHHKGVCQRLHGHNYVVKVEIGMVSNEQRHKDNLLIAQHGMLMDFAEVKDICQGWLDNNWDHQTIIDKHDMPMLRAMCAYAAALSNSMPIACDEGNKPEPPPGIAVILDGPPTAENMAIILLHQFTKAFYLAGISIVKPIAVTVWETPDRCARATKTESLPPTLVM